MATTSASSTWSAVCAKSITLRSTRPTRPASDSSRSATSSYVGVSSMLVARAAPALSSSIWIAPIPPPISSTVRPSTPCFFRKSTMRRDVPSRPRRRYRFASICALRSLKTHRYPLGVQQSLTRLQPAPAPEQPELDPYRDEHRADSEREGDVRRLEHLREIREVHAIEPGQEAQRQKHARDHGQRLGRLVQPVRNRRQVHVHRARQQVPERVHGFVLAHDVVVHVAVVEGHVLLLQVDAVGDERLENIALGAEQPAELD